MPEDMKTSQVRRAAYEVVWHIRLVAITLEHVLAAWSGVAALVESSPAEIRGKRARCMNIIGDLCGQLIQSLKILSGREERFDPEATLARLIECCDLAMADLRVSRLREMLENAGRDQR